MTSPADSPREDRLVLLGTLMLFACSMAITRVWGGGAPGSDVALYARYGDAIIGGAVPYRDLAIEYPPGALAMIVPPALFTSGPYPFGDAFVALAGALLAATIVVTWSSLVRLGERRGCLFIRLLPLALAPMLLGPVAVQRLDPMPAFVVALAMMAAVFNVVRGASLLAGIGAATKLYPVVLLPSLLVRARTLHGRRGVASAAASFLVGAGLVVIPFVVVGGIHGLLDVLRYHVDRPLQIETLGSSAALLLHVLVGFDVGLTTTFGSVNLGGSRGVAIGAAQLALLLLGLGWVVFRTITIASTRTGLTLAAATTVTVVVVLGKVLSPQFLVWLLPLIPLVKGRLGLIATSTLAVAAVLTRIWYEHLYVPVTRGGLDPEGIVLLAFRNGVLLILLGVLLAAVEREARRARRCQGTRTAQDPALRAPHSARPRA